MLVNVPETDGPAVRPWRTLELATECAGMWLVAGDLDGDGAAEIVSARNRNQAVTAVSAYKLDGTRLWSWGEPNAGRAGLTYDVPLQLYDLDGDGCDEVFLSIEGWLVVLEGTTGRELRRHRLPEGLPIADCITFADLRGVGRPTDVIVKTRYEKLWAFTGEWEPLWEWAPTDHRTCHHPTPGDLDGDDKDEIIAAYTALDDDGAPLWTFVPEGGLGAGHLDCSEVISVARDRANTRIALTCCGGNEIAVVDGTGSAVWRVTGHHFESVDVAALRNDVPAPQCIVDIDHAPYGESELWLIDAEGKRVLTYRMGYGRHHRLIDWDGDGLQDLVLPEARRVMSGRGECLAHFVAETGEELEVEVVQPADGDPNPLGFVGDLDGDGRREVILHTAGMVWIYKSDRTPVTACPVGTGVNWTLY